jgi:hypothetical protein
VSGIGPPDPGAHKSEGRPRTVPPRKNPPRMALTRRARGLGETELGGGVRQIVWSGFRVWPTDCPAINDQLHRWHLASSRGMWRSRSSFHTRPVHPRTQPHLWPKSPRPTTHLCPLLESPNALWNSRHDEGHPESGYKDQELAWSRGSNVDTRILCRPCTLSQRT